MTDTYPFHAWTSNGVQVQVVEVQIVHHKNDWRPTAYAVVAFDDHLSIFDINELTLRRPQPKPNPAVQKLIPTLDMHSRDF